MRSSCKKNQQFQLWHVSCSRTPWRWLLRNDQFSVTNLKSTMLTFVNDVRWQYGSPRSSPKALNRNINFFGQSCFVDIMEILFNIKITANCTKQIGLQSQLLCKLTPFLLPTSQNSSLPKKNTFHVATVLSYDNGKLEWHRLSLGRQTHTTLQLNKSLACIPNHQLQNNSVC